ncbi:hypothetical protein Tco_0292969, partial [Tanacetum coccineum]
DLKDYAIIDNGCSGSMTGDKDKLSDFKEFKMSSMGELTFFLGLQVKQSNGGIFLSQDKQDLYHLYRVVEDYYEHIPPTGLGLMLLGDLSIIWETAESSDDDFWKDQEEWEIIRWRFHESSGVHTLEIEDGTMIHMLAERRYPLSRELMIRMLEHGMEVENESETAITCFI